MSLHVLADHMAAHGRGPDSMLVHMSPQEVQSLQELAMKNGGSLTINPETGLPEAGFLDSILPIIAGIALGPAGFGLMSAGMAGLAVGGVTALATGSLEKGLMAGMGAYGGAGITGALAGAGEGAMGLAASEAAQQAALEQGLTGEARSQFLQNAVTDKLAAATPFDKLSTGFTNLGTEAGRTAALDAAGGGMGALKYGAAAIAPIMADQMVDTTTKMPAATDTGYIRQKVYDPISGTYTDVGPVDASKWGNRSFSDIYRGYADGGIVALAQGDLISDTATAPAAPAAPTYTDQQIQDAIAASRQQGFNNDQILQGAQANYGVDVSRFLAPTTPAPNVNQAATTVAQNTGGGGSGLLGGVSQAVRDFAAANPDALSGATAGTTTATTGGAGTGFLSGVLQAVQNAAAANPNLFSGNTATTGGLDALAANQAATGATGAVTPGANNATSGTSGDSGVLTLLANQGAASVTGNTTAAAPAVDQQALAIQAAQAGVNAGKPPAQIAAEVDAQYGIKLNAQNVTDFIAANGIVPQAGSDKYVANIAAAVAAHPDATYDQIYAAMVATGLNPTDVAAAMEKAGLSRAAAYAATNKDFKGVAGGTGLAGLNANIKTAMDRAAITNADTTAADIKKILATYGADSSDFKRATGMTPEEWDATHASTKTPVLTTDNITALGSNIITALTTNQVGALTTNQVGTLTTQPVGVITGTGAVLPISTLSDGRYVVVNGTQVATDAVTNPTTLNTAGRAALPVGVSGNQTATINPNGTVSMNTGTPNMPVGGYTGMESLRDAYTKGGGSLGYTPYTPKTIEEFNKKYTNTGDTKSAYDYLMGKGAYPTKSNVGQIMRPYNEATLGMAPAGNRPTIWDQASGRYIKNPDYVRPMRDSKGEVTYGMSQKQLNTFLTDQAKNPTMSGQELYDWVVKNNVSAQDIADARGVPLSEVYTQFRNFKQAADAKKAADTTADTAATVPVKTGGQIKGYADGGYAVGGGLGSLGSYSDGGRLLRGPGDGVSDSIPASIGQSQQPARLADGEFVVPARIVSELGNGSTEAGARKLYAMMDRVQRARGKTTGKDRVAANTSADKYLPA